MEVIRTVARAAVGGRVFRGRRRIVRAVNGIVGNDKTVWANISNGLMLLDLRVPLENSAFWDRGTDAAPIAALTARLTENGAVAVDVGANIGLFTVPLARATRDVGGHTYAFEPIPATADRLRENVAANGLEATVTVMPIALGANSGRIEIEQEAGGTANARRVLERTDRSISVPLRAFDEVVEELGIARCDVVKVDIEGGELDFLRGAGATIESHRPLLYLELNEPCMSQMGWSDLDVIDLAREWEYEVLVETIDGFSAFRRTGLLDNILLVP
jgi:FkbM family methyltransferase